MTTNDSTSQRNLKEYQIFEFINDDDDGEEKMKEIEFAPKSWISFNEEDFQLYAKFMPPPYNLKSRKFLKQLLKSKLEAPQEWPKYPINLRGHAGKYRFCELYSIILVELLNNYFFTFYLLTYIQNQLHKPYLLFYIYLRIY